MSAAVAQPPQQGRRRNHGKPAAKKEAKAIVQEIKKEAAKPAPHRGPPQPQAVANSVKGKGSYAGDIGAAVGSSFGPAGEILGRGAGELGRQLWKSITGHGKYTEHHDAIVSGLKNRGGKSAHQVLKEIIPKPYTRGEKYYYPGVESLGKLLSTTSFATNAYRLNPGSATTFPLLSVEAQTWQKYDFNKLLFVTVPLDTSAVGSFGTLGWVGGAASLDPEQIMLGTNTAPGPFPNRQAVEDFGLSSSCRGDQPLVIPVECLDSIGGTKSRFVSFDGTTPASATTAADSRLNDLGDAYICTDLFQTAGVNIAEIFVMYECVFSVRVFPAQKSGCDIYNFNTTSSTAPTVINTLPGASNCGITSVQSTGVLVLSPGFWSVNLYGITVGGWTYSSPVTWNVGSIGGGTYVYQQDTPTGGAFDATTGFSFMSGSTSVTAQHFWVYGGDITLSIAPGGTAAVTTQNLCATCIRFATPPLNSRAAWAQLQASRKMREEEAMDLILAKRGFVAPTRKDTVLLNASILATYQDTATGKLSQQQWVYTGPLPPTSGQQAAPARPPTPDPICEEVAAVCPPSSPRRLLARVSATIHPDDATDDDDDTKAMEPSVRVDGVDPGIVARVLAAVRAH